MARVETTKTLVKTVRSKKSQSPDQKTAAPSQSTRKAATQSLEKSVESARQSGFGPLSLHRVPRAEIRPGEAVSRQLCPQRLTRAGTFSALGTFRMPSRISLVEEICLVRPAVEPLGSCSDFSVPQPLHTEIYLCRHVPEVEIASRMLRTCRGSAAYSCGASNLRNE